MKNKLLVAFLCFVVISLLLTVTCTTELTAAENWWDKLGTPKYGGTLNIRTGDLNYVGLDPLTPAMGGGAGVYEGLFGSSWVVDREIFGFKGMYIPAEYIQGCLAESWEQPDASSAIVHLRKGVHWSNKPPTNGREMTADDVVFSYDRIAGTGSGFTSPHPILGSMINYIEDVVAIDKYTVQFKFKGTSAIALYDIFAPQVKITSPEWIKEYGSDIFSMPGPPKGGAGGPPGGPPGGGPGGDKSGGPPGAGPGGGGPGGPPKGGPMGAAQAHDWHTYVSTCPYMITDFIPASRLTYYKIPDYYGFDERHPQNRLPYIDTVNYVSIPDMSTSIAALRTGKIDYIEGGRGSAFTWQMVKSINKTHPEIKTWWYPTDGPTLSLRVDKSPFGDIRVRHALQMAIDRQTIAASYFDGILDGVPCGLISPEQLGWCTPYDKWPGDLKELFEYNPDRARQLLSEAGYPKGFDTNIIASTGSDLELLQIIKSYFQDIGVNMTIKTMDDFAKMDFVGMGKHDQIDYGAFTGGAPNPWQQATVAITGDRQNYTFNNDAKYDSLYKEMKNATTIERAKELVNEMDQYALQQSWMIFLFPVNTPVANQPYVKGYSGEGSASMNGMHYIARWWIDKG